MVEVWRYNVAVTDFEWFSSLAQLPGLDEVNFWQPSPSGVSDAPGTPWLFKLHAPRNFIVGGGFLAYYAQLPAGVAWDTFGIRNGVDSLEAMLGRISKYRKIATREVGDVGCVVLSAPFFFPQDEWIAVPMGWAPNIVRGRHYDVTDSVGAQLWRDVSLRLHDSQSRGAAFPLTGTASAVGKPIVVTPRLGQGAFRIAVLDAYERRCAVTGERTLPALEAAHIRPWAHVKSHEINNGLALRSDLHHLYDQGLISIRPDFSLAVSPEIRERYENGRDYYAMAQRSIRLPANPRNRPDPQALDWHYSERFRR